MNPFPGRAKCAARAAMTLAAMAGLLLAVGCGFGGGNGGGGGGGGNTGFSNTTLNGHYAFSQKGVAVVQGGGATDFFSEAGVFTADGNGNLTNIIDEFTQSGQFFTTFGAPLTGTYHINSDGTGLLIFNFGGGATSNFRITFTDTTHFYLIEQDLAATGAGSGEKQDTGAFNVIPSGNFTFAGHDLFFSSRVGSLSLNAGVIAGLEDILFSGGSVTSQSFTGTIAAPDANGRGQITFSDGSFFFYYVVNSGKFRFLSFSGSLELGVAETQTGGPFTNASLASGNSYVFGSSGETSVVAGIHSAGVFTTDGNGLVTGGATDSVQDGAVFANVAIQNTSDYALAANGRGVLNLDLGNGGTNQKIFWMVSGTRAYFLVNSSATLEDGTLSQQQGAPFTNTGLNAQAALVMDGFDLAFKDRVGTITPNGSGTFNWSQQANSFDAGVGVGTLSSFSTTGTYQLNSNGRVTATVNGLLGNNANSSMVFYLVSNNTGYMVEEDQGFDIGGAFTKQTGT
ncbi:MAG: hypothetical protein WAQ52_04330 [Terriglobales bacterium]